MGAIVNGTIVKWNNVVVNDVVSIDPDYATNMVDCTTLDNEQVDNRSGIENPACEMVVSLKDEEEVPVANGDHGDLSVQLPGVSTPFVSRLRCSNISGGGGSDDPNNVTISFVSTAEEVSGT